MKELSTMRIGLFGGTFDPFHKGHLAIALTARKQFKLQQIYLIPAACSPHKLGKGPRASAQDRLKMLRLAIKPYPFFKVSDFEIKKKGVSYTISTLKFFSKQYPKAEYFFILGADSYRSIKTWKHYDKIRQFSSLLVAPRPGEKVRLFDSRDCWLKTKLDSSASSRIREWMVSGEINKARKMLARDVWSWIQKKKLYTSICQG